MQAACATTIHGVLDRDMPALAPSHEWEAPEAKGTAASVRAFERRDIPRVCELFCRTFRPGRGYRAANLAACVEATYFGSPAYTPQTGSIVHLDETGRVDGFMGVIAITMSAGGRSLHGGILSAYMADDPDRNPGIGAALARAIVGRGFDVLFTDTANRTSLDMARAMRFAILPARSLEWVKILKPAGTGLYFLAKRSARTASWLALPARGLDAAYARFGPSDPVGKRRLDGTGVRAIDAQAFVDGAHSFVAAHALRPAWTERAELAWFVAQAGLQTKYGALHIQEVLDRGGRRAGLYLLYARRGGVAYALQILARPNREDVVVGNLIAHAARLGAVAVRGATSTEATLGLLRQTGIVYHHVMGTIAWTTDPAAAAAIRSGDVFLGGLAGETWARIVTEDFS